MPRMIPMMPSTSPIQARIAVSTLNRPATPNTRAKVAAALVFARRVAPDRPVASATRPARLRQS